jgi:hypothetical protein
MKRYISEGEMFEEVIDFGSVADLRKFLNSGKKHFKDSDNYLIKINRIKKIKSKKIIADCELISIRNWNLEKLLELTEY